MGKKGKDEEQKTSGKGNFIIILVLLLVVVGAGTFGGVYLYLQNKNGEAEKKIEATNYSLLSETTLNLNDESRRAYLKTSVSIAYDVKNESLAEEIEKKKINIQDAAIWYLKSKKSEDFNAENETNLKQGLIDAINSHLEEGQVLAVFLVGEDGAGFVVQKA